MKLSEAIRLGAMLKPQAYGGSAVDGKSCALRAAADAVGIESCTTEHDQLNYKALELRWPLLCEPVTPNVEWLTYEMKVLEAIYRLNDQVEWPRERIADWVEMIESERQPASEEARATNAVAGTVGEARAVTSRLWLFCV